jgi:hypothetical protein
MTVMRIAKLRVYRTQALTPVTRDYCRCHKNVNQEVCPWKNKAMSSSSMTNQPYAA